MEAPACFDFFSGHARHQADQLDLLSGLAFRVRQVGHRCGSRRRRVRRGRGLALEYGADGRHDGAGTHCRRRTELAIAGRAEGPSDFLAEVTEHFALRFGLFRDQEFVRLVGLPAFGDGSTHRQHDFHLIHVVSECRLQRPLQLLRHRIFEPVHEVHLVFDRDVQRGQAVGHIEQDLEKFEIEAPLVLPLQRERLLRRILLHEGDGLPRHGQHEFSQLAELVSIFSIGSSHGSPFVEADYSGDE